MRPIGELFVFGFRGPTIPAWLKAFAGEHGLGGVLLFDYDCLDKKYERNIFNPEQLTQLCAEIHALPSRPLVFIDQEGGRVRRLKDKYGFKPLPSARQFGTMTGAQRMAVLHPAYAEMKAVGIDINLAPVVDVDYNPTGPDIGAFERSFSAEPKVIEDCVHAIVEVARQHGIALCLKHFPGTGAARANPHDDIMDLSKYYSEDQAEIFKTLLPAVNLVLFSHGIVNQWEKGVPVCLSAVAVDKVRDWSPRAVIVTDDLQMQGVQKLMSTQEACIQALRAGADFILIGNNMMDQQEESSDFARRLQDVCSQELRSRENFNASLERIRKLKGL